MDVPDIVVTRVKVFAVPGRVGRFAWHWVYYATGPDGTKFDNGSLVTLRDVLRRRYGKAAKVTESWTGLRVS